MLSYQDTRHILGLLWFLIGTEAASFYGNATSAFMSNNVPLSSSPSSPGLASSSQISLEVAETSLVTSSLGIADYISSALGGSADSTTDALSSSSTDTSSSAVPTSSRSTVSSSSAYSSSRGASVSDYQSALSLSSFSIPLVVPTGSGHSGPPFVLNNATTTTLSDTNRPASAGFAASSWNSSTTANSSYTNATARSCEAEWVAYWSSSTSYQSAHPYTFLATDSYSGYRETVIDSTVSISVTTLCDGIPRAVLPLPGYVTSRPGTTYVRTTTALGNYTRTPPSCGVGEDVCAKLFDDHTSAVSFWWATRGPESNSPLPPPCTTANWNCAPQQCTLEFGVVQLFYWPVTTASGDLCGGNGSTITATPTGDGPNTAVLKGVTYTSPSVYVSFDTVSDFGACGSAYTGVVISMAPESLSSIRGYHGIGGSYSFNYADLNYPVPWSAYNGMGKCIGGCPTIFDDQYAPMLAYPPNILEHFNPAWTSCRFFEEGLYDPPIAIKTASNLMPHPTSATPITSTAGAAKPSSPASSPFAPSTATAVSQSAILPSPVEPGQPSIETGKAPGSGLDGPALPVNNHGSISSAAADPAPNPSAIEARPTAQPNGDPDIGASRIGELPGVAGVRTILVGGEVPHQPASIAGPAPAEGSPMDPADPVDPTSIAVAADPPVSASNAGIAVTRTWAPKPASATGVRSAQNVYDPPPASVTLLPTIAGQAFSVDLAPSGAVIIDGKTLSPGGSAVNINGVPVSLASGALVIGTSTIHVPRTSALTAGNQFGADVGASTASAGAAVTGAVFAIGSQTVTAVDPENTVVIGSVTLTIGGPPATISGVAMSAAIGGIVVAGSMIPYSVLATPTPIGASPSKAAAVVTIGSQTLTAEWVPGPTSAVVIGSTTLTVGGPAVTIFGAIISAGTAGIAVEGHTLPYSVVPSPTPTTTAGAQAVAIFTIGSQTLTATQVSAAGGAVRIGSTTLSVGGPPVTIGGHTVSLGSNGLVVDGTATASLSTATGSTTAGRFGGYTGRTSISGTDPGAQSTSAPDLFEGAATACKIPLWLLTVLGVGLVAVGGALY